MDLRSMSKVVYDCKKSAQSKISHPASDNVHRGALFLRCVQRLCDPRLSDVSDLTGLFECAPHAPVALQCLTGGQDHTPCCRARGMPEPCRDLCGAGNKSVKFDYVHLR